MAIRDFTSQRLYLDADLAHGARLELEAGQAHYLTNVLRLGSGAHLLVFNGRDGEWVARLETTGKRKALLVIGERERPQEAGPDLHYLFAPLKRSRLDYMVQKATELGVSRLVPVITRRTIAERVNAERMRANVIEAAEQCGILRVPGIQAPATLGDVLVGWEPARTLVFCDEAAEIRNPIAALEAVGRRPVAVLIGPEGGFTDDERRAIAAVPGAVRLSLGPRIMRADTAAVAALALVNAVNGDWRPIEPA